MIDKLATIANASLMTPAALPRPGFWTPIVPLWRALKKAHQLHRARRQLLALDDRLLADAGIGRHEIDTVIDALARDGGTMGAWR